MLGWRSIGGSHPRAPGTWGVSKAPYAFTTLPLYQGLIAIIHRAVLTTGPIVGAKAILAAQLNECFSCCSDDYHLFNVQAVVHQGEALPE